MPYHDFNALKALCAAHPETREEIIAEIRASAKHHACYPCVVKAFVAAAGARVLEDLSEAQLNAFFFRKFGGLCAAVVKNYPFARRDGRCQHHCQYFKIHKLLEKQNERRKSHLSGFADADQSDARETVVEPADN
jgi:hypothetical protein